MRKLWTEENEKKNGGGGGIAPISNKSPIEMSEQLRELLFLALRGTWPRREQVVVLMLSFFQGRGRGELILFIIQ